jgi:hypothetical protein
MLVKELIDVLKKVDSDKEVFLQDDGVYVEISEIKITLMYNGEVSNDLVIVLGA